MILDGKNLKRLRLQNAQQYEGTIDNKENLGVPLIKCQNSRVPLIISLIMINIQQLIVTYYDPITTSLNS